jgi:uncharacterized protein YndB with AHSA1/START domain
MSRALHATLVFEREIAAPQDAVFAAIADPVARARWGVPSDTAVVIYDEADFREGGQDRFRCGSRAHPDIHGATRYLEIVLNRRVVSSETIVRDGQCMCVSLTTLELTPDGHGTRLKSTTQMASLIGQEMVEGHVTGTHASLDRLVQYLQK